jgi:hypothetical protein
MWARRAHLPSDGREAPLPSLPAAAVSNCCAWPTVGADDLDLAVDAVHHPEVAWWSCLRCGDGAVLAFARITKEAPTMIL